MDRVGEDRHGAADRKKVTSTGASGNIFVKGDAADQAELKGIANETVLVG